MDNGQLVRELAFCVVAAIIFWALLWWASPASDPFFGI